MKFQPIARENHEKNGVKKYHWFLTKTQAISGQGCGSHGIFIQNSKTYQYMCNRSSIDDTNVMHIVAAVGREFRFPLDT